MLGGERRRNFSALSQSGEPDSELSLGCRDTLIVPHGDQLTYSSYLKVPELLELQAAAIQAGTPRRIAVHHRSPDLRTVVQGTAARSWMPWSRICRPQRGDPQSHDEVYEAARLLRRCTEITRVLVEQFTILETMLPTHFLAFRGKLEPASGFQSEQFRELEFLCGLKDEKMLRYHKPTPEAHAQLERRLREPSLHEALFAALHAIGKLGFADRRIGERAVRRARSRGACPLQR